LEYDNDIVNPEDTNDKVQIKNTYTKVRTLSKSLNEDDLFENN
jgi:hypothetical protein